jgi:hypothetical protein
VPGIVRDLFESIGPVVATAGEDLDRLVGKMDLDPVAVELDFVKQRVPDGTFSIEVAKAGSMNLGKGAFTPMAAGFRR